MKYLILTLTTVSVSNSSSGALRGHLKKLPYPLVAASVTSRLGKQDTHAVDDNTAGATRDDFWKEKVPLRFSELTNEEIVKIINAHDH